MATRNRSGLLTFLADDLTGAMDTGVQAVKWKQAPVFCLWHPENLVSVPEGAIVILDTESRNLPEPLAVAAVSAAVKALHAAGRTADYKKIDSTMRGHVAAEINELLQSGLYQGILVCPALPAQGRVVSQGILLVDGVPLMDTDLGHDPLFPMATSSLVEMLQHTGAVSVQPGEAANIPDRLERGERILVGDAASSEDLLVWSRAAIANNLLPVGSAGLASVWPYEESSSLQPAGAESAALPAPVAFICGSPASRTLAQIGRLLESSPLLPHIHPGRTSLLGEDGDPTRQTTLFDAREEIRRLLQEGHDLLLNVVHVAKGDILATEGSAESARYHADRILQSLADLSPALDDAGSLVLLGGDTARVLLDASGAYALEILGDALPQIPFARIHGGRWHGKPVITKAGGFGGPDALVDLLSMRS